MQMQSVSRTDGQRDWQEAGRSFVGSAGLISAQVNPWWHRHRNKDTPRAAGTRNLDPEVVSQVREPHKWQPIFQSRCRI